ncbi:hypothetical protein [Paenibacillus sp. AGC30]
MPVKIGKNTNIGDNNAIGDNANVSIQGNKKAAKEIDNENKMWFSKHPWISAIICSVIASIIMLINWDQILKMIKLLLQ